MFKNWGQALSIALMFYISLAKGLQLKVKNKKSSRANTYYWKNYMGRADRGNVFPLYPENNKRFFPDLIYHRVIIKDDNQVGYRAKFS